MKGEQCLHIVIFFHLCAMATSSSPSAVLQEEEALFLCSYDLTDKTCLFQGNKKYSSFNRKYYFSGVNYSLDLPPVLVGRSKGYVDTMLVIDSGQKKENDIQLISEQIYGITNLVVYAMNYTVLTLDLNLANQTLKSLEIINCFVKMKKKVYITDILSYPGSLRNGRNEEDINIIFSGKTTIFGDFHENNNSSEKIRCEIQNIEKCQERQFDSVIIGNVTFVLENKTKSYLTINEDMIVLPDQEKTKIRFGKKGKNTIKTNRTIFNTEIINENNSVLIIKAKGKYVLDIPIAFSINFSSISSRPDSNSSKILISFNKKSFKKLNDDSFLNLLFIVDNEETANKLVIKGKIPENVFVTVCDIDYKTFKQFPILYKKVNLCIDDPNNIKVFKKMHSMTKCDFFFDKLKAINDTIGDSFYLKANSFEEANIFTQSLSKVVEELHLFFDGNISENTKENQIFLEPNITNLKILEFRSISDSNDPIKVYIQQNHEISVKHLILNCCNLYIKNKSSNLFSVDFLSFMDDVPQTSLISGKLKIATVYVENDKVSQSLKNGVEIDRLIIRCVLDGNKQIIFKNNREFSWVDFDQKSKFDIKINEKRIKDYPYICNSVILNLIPFYRGNLTFSIEDGSNSSLLEPQKFIIDAEIIPPEEDEKVEIGDAFLEDDKEKNVYFPRRSENTYNNSIAIDDESSINFQMDETWDNIVMNSSPTLRFVGEEEKIDLIKLMKDANLHNIQIIQSSPLNYPKKRDSDELPDLGNQQNISDNDNQENFKRVNQKIANRNDNFFKNIKFNKKMFFWKPFPIVTILMMCTAVLIAIAVFIVHCINRRNANDMKMVRGNYSRIPKLELYIYFFISQFYEDQNSFFIIDDIL